MIIGWPPSSAIAGLEGDPGPRRRLVEQHRDRSRPGEGAQPVWLGLEVSARSRIASCSAGLRSSSTRKCLIVHSSATWSRRDGSAPDEAVEFGALMISGGARRSTSGRGALITKPAASAASTTAAAIGSAKITACSSPRPRTPVIKR